MKVCKICNKQFKTLGQHVYWTHKLNSKDYYDLYEKQENEDKCEWCGNVTKFQTINKGYERFCCATCRGHGLQEEIQETKKRRYGDPKYMNREQAAETMKNKSQEEKDEIWRKKQETWEETYGVDHPMKSEECLENYHNTLEELYGDRTYNNQEQTKITKLEKYGDPYYNNSEKRIQTNLERYGIETTFELSEMREKSKVTKQEK